jgi:hypothetical protein
LLNTEMPGNPNNPSIPGYPFVTYYFRTHFTFTNSVSEVSLLFDARVDDGAVFYLNGAEAYRNNLPPAPTPILNANLASAYNCGGDATCPVLFSLAGSTVTNLVSGDNVIAVEVHNYNIASPDITFGTALTFTEPYTLPPQLSIAPGQGAVTLSWTRGGFTLQQAPAVGGPWTDVPGPIFSSPFTATNSASQVFFRLRK